MNLDDKTDIIVTCDHGFDHEPAADVLAPLRESGLAPGEVVVDNEGGASLFYVRNRDAEKISRLVTKFQAGDNTNAIFVASSRPVNGSFACSSGTVKGFVPGTFSLELAGQCVPSRGPDMIVTYRWDAAANPFGVPGTQWVPGTKQQAARNGHGGLNPYVTHSTLIAAGPDFAQGKTIDVPAGNQDIAPTLLALQGLRVPESLDGRVLSEALRKPPTAGKRKSSARRVAVSAGTYCAEIEISYAGDHRYLDQARRCAAKP
jgi:arylsulfatase A-like enzyme